MRRLLARVLFVAALLLAPPAWAAIGTPTLVGHGGDANGGAATFTFPTTNAIVSGNLAIVVVAINNTNPTARTVTAVSDGTNTYTKAISHAFASPDFNDLDLEVWYKANASAVGSGATVTVTYSAADASNTGSAEVFQVSGIATTTPYDTAGVGAAAQSSAPNSGTTGTLAQSSEIVLGVNQNNNNGVVYTAASGFTNLINNQDPSGSGFNNISVDYKIVSATTALAHNPGLNSSSDWIDIAAPFEGGGSVAVVSNRMLMGIGQ